MTTLNVCFKSFTLEEASQALDVVSRGKISPPTQVVPGHKFDRIDPYFVASCFQLAQYGNDDIMFVWETLIWYLKSYVSTLKYSTPGMVILLKDFVPLELFTRTSEKKGYMDVYTQKLDDKGNPVRLGLDGFIQIIKGWTNAPMSLLHGNCETSEFTSPLYGKTRHYLIRFIKQGRKKSNQSKQVAFANTCLQMKRVASTCPDVTKDSNVGKFENRINKVYKTTAEIDSEFQKTRVNLPGKSTFLNSFGKAIKQLNGKLKFSVAVFADYRDDEIKDLSLRSTVESKIKECGSFGYFTEARDLQDDADQEMWLRPDILQGRKLKKFRQRIRSEIRAEVEDEVTFNFHLDSLVNNLMAVTEEIESKTPSKLDEKAFSTTPLAESRKNPQLKELINLRVGEIYDQRYRPVKLLDSRPFIRRYEVDNTKIVTYFSRILPTYGETLNRVKKIIRFQRKVVGICEPLKVRIITMHHAYEAVLFAKEADLQQKSFLKCKEILSGKILRPETFFEISKFLERHPEGLVVSDDGDAATDSTNLDVLSENMKINFSEEIYNRLLPSLVGDFSYMNSTGDLQTFTQVTGQMMGARYSFVLLCKMHYAWKKLFLCNMKYIAEDQVFFINGDDGVACLKNKEHVELYKAWMSMLWSLNKMKTYVSRHYLSFNSAIRLTSNGEEVPLVRWNIIRGIDKFGDHSKDPSLFNLLAKDGKGLIPEADLWRFFIGVPHWRDVLNKLDNDSERTSNWFLPKALGGYGIEREASFAITKRQLSLIKYWDRFDTKRIRRHVTKTVPSNEDKVHRALMNVVHKVKTFKTCIVSELGQETFNPNAKNVKLKTIDSPALKVVPLPHSLGRDRDIVRITEFWDRSLLCETLDNIKSREKFVLTDEEINDTNEISFFGQGPEAEN